MSWNVGCKGIVPKRNISRLLSCRYGSICPWKSSYAVTAISWQISYIWPLWNLLSFLTWGIILSSFWEIDFFWIYNTCCYPWIFFVGFVWCFPVSRNLILRLHCFLFLFLLPGTWTDPIHGSLAVFITSDQLSFLIHLFPKMRCTYMQKFLVHLYLLLFLTPVLWHSWSNNKLQVIVGTVCMIGLY